MNGFDPTTVAALMFDVFGTLVDWRTSVTREGKALGTRLGVEADWEALADAWRGRYQPSMERVRSGERPWTELDDLHRESLDALLHEHGIEGLGEADLDHFNRAWHRLEPWPDTVEGLERLHTRFLLVTCSNGNVALLANLARAGRLPFDAILGPPVARHYKPQDEAYLTTARLLRLEPHECMMVAAHNSDLVKAASLGFRTAFVSRPTEYGPHQDGDFEAENAYDVVGGSLVEVAEKMGC